MHSPRHRKKGTVHATKKLGEGRNRFSPGSLKKTTTTTTKAQAAEVHNNMQVRNTGYRMYCCNVQRWEWKAFAFLHTTHRSTILFFVWAFSFKKASPVQLCTLHVHNRRHPKMKTGIKGGGEQQYQFHLNYDQHISLQTTNEKDAYFCSIRSLFLSGYAIRCLIRKCTLFVLLWDSASCIYVQTGFVNLTWV